jgi:AcrR family transcriptional regulator
MAETAISIETPAESSASSCLETLDPRIRRTRELLQQALSTLLESREFERISVHDITDAAGVNRATFYAHYPDKFALLECMVASRFQALLSARGVVFDGTCFGALQGIVLGVCDYLAQTLGASPCPSQQRPLEPHLESAIVAVVERMILHGITQHPTPANLPPAMLAASAGWAIYGAARQWAQTPQRAPSEEIAPLIVGLILPILSPPSLIAPNLHPPSA